MQTLTHPPNCGKRQTQEREALSRAQSGLSWSNFPAIFQGFAAKGISESDIKPRENVFTFKAWRALGRTVKRGEHGVKVVTWIQRPEVKDESGKVTTPAASFCKRATVFHVSQTKPLNGEVQS